MPTSQHPSNLQEPAVVGDDASLVQRVQSLRIPKHSGSESNVWPRVAWLLCCIFASTTAWFAYLAFRPPPPSPSVDAEAVAVADVTQAAKGAAEVPAGQIVLESKGYVIPTRQILVSPQVSGRVVSLKIEEGQKVSKGDILAELETTEYAADLKGAEANLKRARQRLLELERGNRPEEISQAEKELEETKALLVQLDTEHKRNEELFETNTLTERDLLQSKSDWNATQRRVERFEFKLQLLKKGPRIEQIEIARADVEQFEADAEKSRWRLDNCTIRAPITGTILKKNAEDGNIVNPVAFNGSYSLCDMADLSDLEVDLNIQERDVSRVFQNQKCTIRSEAFSDRIYEGYVSRLMPIADRAKGAVPVRVKIQVPAGEEGVYLKPEMGATVAFYNETRSTLSTTVTDKPEETDDLETALGTR